MLSVADGELERRRRVAAGEVHVELPAVGQAVRIAVVVAGTQREFRPRAVQIHRLFVGDAERLEVADHEVLVERRERLGVDAVSRDRFGGSGILFSALALRGGRGLDGRRLGIGRRRIESKEVVHAAVDDDDFPDLNRPDPVGDIIGRRTAHRQRAVVVERRVVAAGGLVLLLAAVRDHDVAAVNLALVVHGDRDMEVGDDVRHHVLRAGHVTVRNKRVDTREDSLPAVGHAVAVRIPLLGIGSVDFRFIIVLQAVTIAVIVRAGDRDRSVGCLEIIQAFQRIGHAVLVEIGILDVNHRHGRLDRLGLHLHARRRVDVRGVHIDLVGIAPGFVAVAHAVVVAVDERDEIDLAGLEATQHRVGRRQIGAVAEEREVCQTRTGMRRAGEVRRVIRLDEDVRGRVARSGTVVAHHRRRRAVAGQLAVRARDTRREVAPVAPVRVGRLVDRRELGVQEPHAPAVAAAVREDRRAVGGREVDIQIGRERVGAVQPRRQELRAGIVDDRPRIVAHLQTKGGHRLVLARPDERRRGLDDGGALDRRDRPGGAAGGVERVDERHQLLGADRAGVGNGQALKGIGHARDICGRDIDARRRRVQCTPVEAVDAVAHHITLVQIAATACGECLGENRGVRCERTVVDGLAYNAVGAARRTRLLRRALATGRRTAGRTLQRVAVAHERRHVHARQDRRGVGQLDDGLGRVEPAHVHALGHAEGLAGGVDAIAVQIVERGDRVRSAAHVSRAGLAEVEIQTVVGEFRPGRGVLEAQHGARQRVGAVGAGQPVFGERPEVEIVRAGLQIDRADALAQQADVALVADRDAVGLVELAPDEGGRRLQHHAVRAVGVVQLHVLVVGQRVEASGAAGDDVFQADELHHVFRIAVDGRELDVERLGVDVARRQRAVDDAVAPLADVARELLRFAALDRERRVGAFGSALRVGLDDDRRLAHLLAAVVGERQAQRRNRHVLDFGVADDMRDAVGRDRRGEAAVAQLLPVGPAVAVRVVVRIVDARIRVAPGIARLPPVFHEVMVADDFAEIPVRLVRAALAEVVAHEALRLVGDRRERVETDGPAVGAGAPAERRALGDEVFLVVRQAVVIRVVVRAHLADALQHLPPVGQAVAVHVRGLRVGRIDAARDQAVGQRVGVCLRRRVAGVARPLRDARAVRIAVKGRAVRRDRPDVLRALAVPAFREALRERRAERNEVARAGELVADVGVVDAVQAVAELEELVQRVVLLQLERREAVGIHRVRERERAEAVERGRRVARVVLAPVHAVQHRAAHARQVGDRVLNPRHDVRRGVDLVGRDRRVRQDVVPPADLDEVAHLRVVRIAHEREHVRREARRDLLDVLRLGRAGQRREVVVLDQLGIKRVLGVVVVARRALPTLGDDPVAQRLHVADRVALPVVGRDLVERARAVPDAHFVDAALEEMARERLPRRAGRRARLERRRARAAAEGGRRRVGAVGVVREAARVLRILHLAVDAVGRDHRRRQRAHLHGVFIEPERLAVERQREVHPRVRRERRADDLHEALARRAVEARERTAALVDAEREVEAHDRVGVEEIPRGIVDAARDDVLAFAGRRSFRPHPRLHRELAEERLPVGVATDRLERQRDARIVLAAEVDGLAAADVVEVQRIARRLDHLLHLGLVAAEVAVGIVAFVHLVRRELRRAERRRGHRVIVVVERRVRRAAAERQVGADVRHDHVDLNGIAGAVQNRQSGDGREVRRHRLDLHHRHLEGTDGRIRHPQRRRVGMVGVGRGEVGHERLFLVPQAVAVGVAHARAHHPRIADRVERRRLVRRIPFAVKADPAVLPRADGVVAVVDDVLRADVRGERLDERHVVRHDGDVRFARLARIAQDRVEAVEELPVVVHAVLVGIPQARIAADIAGGARRREDEIGGRQDVRLDRLAGRLVPEPGHAEERERADLAGRDRARGVGRGIRQVDFRAVGELPDGGQAGRRDLRLLLDQLRRQHVPLAEVHARMVPFAGRQGQVAEVAQVVARLVRRLVAGHEIDEVRVADLLQRRQLRRREARRVAHFEEPALAVLVTAEPAARQIGAAAQIELRRIEAHQRRVEVVVAEVAHRLHHVLLPVLEAVAVPVEIGRAQLDLGRGVIEGAVHAHEDVVAAFRDVGRAAEGQERGGDVVEDRRVRRALLELAVDDAGAREERTGVLAFPRVGQAVAVRIEAGRVQAAAADAERAVVGRRTVDEVVGDLLRLQRAGRRALAPAVHREEFAPGGALGAVVDAVAVRVDLARIGREELVEPVHVDAARLRRMVRVNAVAAGVRERRVGAGVFAHERQAVIVGRIVADRRDRVSVGIHVPVPVERVVPVARLRDREVDLRIDADVQFPAVRHAVGIGVRAVAARAVLLGAVADRRSRLRLGARVGAVERHVALDRVLLVRADRHAGDLAELEEQELVQRGIGRGVDGRAARNRHVVLQPALRRGERPVAAVHIPAGARIEALVPVDLGVVEVDHRGRDDMLVRRRAGLERERHRLRHHLFGGVERLRDVAAPEPRDREAGAGEGRHRAVVAVRVRRDGPEVARRRLEDRVGGRRVAVGHEVAVVVGLAVGRIVVRRRLQRIEVVQHLVEVAQTVAVGVPVDRTRADQHFLEIEEAVVVRVLLGRLPVGVRVVDRGDVGGRDDVVGAFDVGEVEPRAGDRRASAGRVDAADGRRVPQRVFIAVGQAVAVGVVARRIGAVLDREAPLRGRIALFVAAPGPVDVGFRRRLLRRVGRRQPAVRQIAGDVARRQRRQERVGQRRARVRLRVADEVELFGQAQVEVGDPAVGGLLLVGAEHAVVQAVVGTADLQPRGERTAVVAAPRGGCERHGDAPGQEVEVVVQRVDLRARLGTGAVRLLDRAVRVALRHGEEVRHAVGVDVAHVVRRAPFAREDRLQEAVGVGVGRLVELVGARQRHRRRVVVRVGERRRVVRVRAVVRAVAGERRLAARRHDPAVEVAVVRERARGAVAEPAGHVAHAGERRRGRRHAERQRAAVRELLRRVADERAVLPHVAGAEALRVDIGRGDRRDVRAVRAVRVDDDVLRRIDHVEDRARGRRAVLVRHRQDDRLRARRVKLELVGAAHRADAAAGGVDVVGDDRRHALDRDRDRRVRREVARDVAHRPVDDVVDADRRLVRHDLARLRRRHDDGVDVLRIHREGHEVGVELPVRLARVRRFGVGQHVRGDLHAVDLRVDRAVDRGEVDVLRRGAEAGVEGDRVHPVRDARRRLDVVGRQVQLRQREGIARDRIVDLEADGQRLVGHGGEPHGERRVDRAGLVLGIDRRGVHAARGDLHAGRRVDDDVERELVAVGVHVLVLQRDRHLVGARRLEGEVRHRRVDALRRQRVRVAADRDHLRQRRAVVEGVLRVEAALAIGRERVQVPRRGLVHHRREAAGDALGGLDVLDDVAVDRRAVDAVELHERDGRDLVDDVHHQRAVRVAVVRLVAVVGIGRIVRRAERLVLAQEHVERHQLADRRAVLELQRRVEPGGRLAVQDFDARHAVRRERGADVHVVRRRLVRRHEERVEVAVRRVGVAQEELDLERRALARRPVIVEAARHLRRHLRRLGDLDRERHVVRRRRLRSVRRLEVHRHRGRACLRELETEHARRVLRRAVDRVRERHRLELRVAAARRVRTLVEDRVALGRALEAVRVRIVDAEILEEERFARERALEHGPARRVRDLRRRRADRQRRLRARRIVVARAGDRRDRQDDAVLRLRAAAQDVEIERRHRATRRDRHLGGRLAPARRAVRRRERNVVVGGQVHARRVGVLRAERHRDVGGVRLAQLHHHRRLRRLVVRVRVERERRRARLAVEVELRGRRVRHVHADRARDEVRDHRARVVVDVGRRVRHEERRRRAHRAQRLEVEALAVAVRRDLHPEALRDERLAVLVRAVDRVLGADARAVAVDDHHVRILRPHVDERRGRVRRAVHLQHRQRRVDARRVVRVDRAPDRVAVRVGVEVDLLDVEARARERVVIRPLAALGTGGVDRVFVVDDEHGLVLGRVAVRIDAPEMVVGQAVDDAPLGEARDVRAARRGREHDRQRQIARPRREAEDEIGRQAVGNGRAGVRRLAQLARDVDVHLQRVGRARHLRHHHPRLRRRIPDAVDETQLEVVRRAVDRIRDRADRHGERRARRVARQNLDQVAGGACRRPRRQGEGQDECFHQFHLHGLILPSASHCLNPSARARAPSRPRACGLRRIPPGARRGAPPAPSPCPPSARGPRPSAPPAPGAPPPDRPGCASARPARPPASGHTRDPASGSFPARAPSPLSDIPSGGRWRRQAPQICQSAFS